MELIPTTAVVDAYRPPASSAAQVSPIKPLDPTVSPTATNFASQGGAGSRDCSIPAYTTTAAIVVKFTVVNLGAGGYITAFPANA